MSERIDDGSLEFLQIPRDENSKYFNCTEAKQSALVNLTFWVCDFIEDVPTRFSKAEESTGKTLFKIKMNRDDPESAAKKVFTGSPDILYILRKIKELNAFPRRVTLKCQGNRYYFE
jgi:hypothetical protein